MEIKALLQSSVNSTAASPEQWANGAWFKALFDPVTAQLGDGLFGLLLGGTVLSTLYIAGRGDMAAPTIAILLFAPALTPVIPATMHGILWGVAIAGASTGIFGFMKKYVMEP